jgi:hypothetical protein
MPNLWFDSEFIKRYNNEILPFVQNKLDEGRYLDQEILFQKNERRAYGENKKQMVKNNAFQRAMLRAQNREEKKEAEVKDSVLGTGDFFSKKQTLENSSERQNLNIRLDRKERERVKTGIKMLGRHVERRGEMAKLDAESGQSTTPYYMREQIEEILEDKKSGLTRRHRDMFSRGMDGVRRAVRPTKLSLTGDENELEAARKRDERRRDRKLNEFFSVISKRSLNEEETEQEQSEGQEESQSQNTEGAGTEEPVSPFIFAMYFEQIKQMRSKVKNVFENLSNISYKTLSETVGVRSINENDRDFQLENAIITISRVCSGASEQELRLMMQLSNGRLIDFNEEAFDVARKLLLEIGENCFQNLFLADELGVTPDIQGAERTNILCGENRFKLVTGKVYIKEYTNSPNYGVKMQNMIKSFIPFCIPQDPQVMQNDQISILLQQLKSQLQNFMINLVDDTNPDLMQMPNMIKKIQSMGLADENGNIYDQAKFSNFDNVIKQYANSVASQPGAFKKSFFFERMKLMLTNYFVRGMNQMDERANATHLLTDNGLFLIDDNLVSLYAEESNIKLSLKEKLKSNSGRKNKNSGVPKKLEKLRAIVEEVKETKKAQEPKVSIDMFVIDTISLLQNIDIMIYETIMDNFDMEYTLSLNPGNKVSPKEKKNNEFNIIKINDQEIKIPVVMDKGDMANKVIKENLILEKLMGHEKHYSKKTSHHRSNRNKARRAAEEKWGKAAIKGKDVDHKDGNPMNNSPSNLRLRNPSDNRADNGHHKGEPYKKAKRGITNTYKGKDK